tara:strand:+ start:3659 stop:4975 length:1317 start_codon:yes stop_codon:yes gene_type:complete
LRVNFKESLIQKIKKKEIKIGIIGLGYVGLPLSLTFSEKGLDVYGFDIDKTKIDSIMNGLSYIQHIENNRIKNAVASNKFNPTTNFKEISEVDVIIICVPTPLDIHREPDLSYIISTLDCIKPHLKEGQLLSLESTTYPGTTDEIIKPIIEEKGLTIGQDFFLIYSPEREDPGNKKYNTSNIPKIVGGITKECTEIGVILYQQSIIEVVDVSNTRAAEMTKLLENIHRAVNIGLVNELKPLADKMGIDLYEVIRAAATKPFGFNAYYPGPGLGGHCIPIDPFYLTWKAREYQMHTRFIELAGEINNNMPNYVLEKIIESLNDRGKPLKGSKILILGISYKKNIDDMRESPSVILMELIKKKGGDLSFCDPYFKSFPKMREHSFNLLCIDINEHSLPKFDAVILATDHDSFDYKLIEQHSRLIIDTRGRFKPSPKIVRA